MTPTMKLRFIEQGTKAWNENGTKLIPKTHLVLQQWFVYSDAECHKRVANADYTTGEWVDVPLEEKL